jgi:hypothetical protein
MKRNPKHLWYYRFHVVWSVLTLLLLAAPMVFATDVQLPLIHSQNFEIQAELPSGWEWLLTSNSPDKPIVATDPTNPGNRVLAMSRTANTNALTGRIYTVFNPVKERLQVSFRMLATTDVRALRLILGGTANTLENIHGSATYSGIYLITNGGRFNFLRDVAANKWVSAGSYTPGQWVKVTLDLDIPAQSLDVYIDDAQMPSNTEPIAFLVSYDDFNTISFSYQSVTSQNNTAPMYIDDLVIRGK